MVDSRTYRISSALAAVAVSVVVAIVACPGKKHGSKPVEATLLEVAVTPTNPTIARGTAQQFTATGTFSDGRTIDLTALADWTSSDTTAGDVSMADDGRGHATGLNVGSTTITATYSGVSGATTLTVSSAALVSIEVTPTNPQIALGTSEEFAATGLFTDGTTQDLTAEVQWDSSATSTSSISNDVGTHGHAQSLGLGDTTITATLTGVSGSTTLTVTNAELVSIEVTPTNPSIALGTNQQFAATGTFTDGTTQDLTAEVQWESSAAGTSSISNDDGSRGLAHSLGLGDAAISATYSGLAGSTTLTVSDATLVSIAVTPVLPVIALGTTQPFTATGTFTDGTTQDLTAQVVWSSSDDSISTVANSAGDEGVASSVAMGTTTVSAAFSGISGSTTLEVSNPLLVSIEVTPSYPSAVLGTTRTFVATGIYTDGSTQDVTGEVTWTTSDAAIATVSNADGSRGLATTVAVGSTTIAAALGGKSGSTVFVVSDAELVAIAVSPDVATLAAGTTQTFTALGLFSDGTRQDLTDQVTWSSSDDAVATVSGASGSEGLVTSATVGNVTISASFAGVSGSATVDVSSATLVSIDISPFVTSIAKGTQVQFTALGNFSDGSSQDMTSQVTWSSTGAGVAAISNAEGSQGLGTGLNVGSTTITAEFSGVSEAVDLGVTAAVLVAIELSPVNPSVPVGASLTLQAAGRFSDATTQDMTAFVTWSSSNGSVATVSNAAGNEGLVVGVGGGTAQITATLLGESSSTTLTVTTATLVSLSISPVDAFVPAGYSIALQAVGTYTDGSTRSMNAEVLWSSSNTSVATISNSVGTEGLVTGRVMGSTTLSATLPGNSGTTLLTVTNEVLSSIVLEPDTVALVVGEKQQMMATGYFSAGSVLDLTSLVKWQVTPRSVATVANGATGKGVVTARKKGSTTIRASRDTKTGTASLSVSAP